MFKLLYYRTLYSQSAASLTIGYLAAYIRQLGATAEISLLELGGMNNAQKVLRNTNPLDILIYKVNYQDYKEGCEILRAVKHFCPDRKVYLLGYFAEMNCAALGKKYDFIDGIIFHDGCYFIQKYLESNGDELCGGMFKKEPQNSFFYNDQVKNIPLSELPFPARDIEKLEKHSYINITKSVGCYGKCWPLIEKQQIIPVLGRIITRSITDCPWHTKILEAEQRSKEMALSSFIHKSKLGILEKYKIKEIEVNAIDPNALTFYHDHHINVTCYENSRILSVARVCFHAKFYDFSPESVCNCQSCSSECYHIELLQKCSRTTKMFCDATDRDKAYYDNLFVWGNIVFKKVGAIKKVNYDYIIIDGE